MFIKHKFFIFLLSTIFLFPFGFRSYATNNHIESEQRIESYIYKILNDYESGNFKERNDLNSVHLQELLPDHRSISNNNIVNLYDNRKIGANQFEATRISIVKDLEQSNQTAKNEIVAFTTIVYNTLDMNDAFDYVMLTKIKGGIVRQDGNVSASSLSFKYWVTGDAYNSSGVRQGLKGSSVDYNGELNNPKVGTTYYIGGPKDYYYCMGAYGSQIAGYMRVSLSNGSSFESTSAITSY